MSLPRVLVILLLGICIQLVHSDPVASASKKRIQSDVKDVLHVDIHPLSKHGAGPSDPVKFSHISKVRVNHAPNINKPAVVDKKQILDKKKKRKPTKLAKQLRIRGNNLTKKIKHALKPGQKRTTKRIPTRRQKLRKQLRNFRFRSRKQNRANRVKIGQNRRNWRNGRKFPRWRLNVYRKRKGNTKKGNSKQGPRKMTRNLKMKGLKNRGRLLTAIRSAIGSLQRDTRGKKKSRMSSGYIRRLVGIPAKRFRGKTDIKQLNLKDVLKKAGVELPKNQTGNKSVKQIKKVLKKGNKTVRKDLTNRKKMEKKVLKKWNKKVRKDLKNRKKKEKKDLKNMMKMEKKDLKNRNKNEKRVLKNRVRKVKNMANKGKELNHVNTVHPHHNHD